MVLIAAYSLDAALSPQPNTLRASRTATPSTGEAEDPDEDEGEGSPNGLSGTEEVLTKAFDASFRQLDTDKDGKLSAEELRRLGEVELNELGGQVTITDGAINGLVEAPHAMKIGDTEPRDGVLDKGEWIGLFTVVIKMMKGEASAEEKQVCVCVCVLMTH